MRKCIICDRGPARTEKGYCLNCHNAIEAEKRRLTLQREPVKFISYRGHVVGLYRNGDALVARLLKRDPEKLVKSKTIDLNKYCPGFTREQIKKMKRCVLHLAHA